MLTFMRSPHFWRWNHPMRSLRIQFSFLFLLFCFAPYGAFGAAYEIDFHNSASENATDLHPIFEGVEEGWSVSAVLSFKIFSVQSATGGGTDIDFGPDPLFPDQTIAIIFQFDVLPGEEVSVLSANWTPLTSGGAVRFICKKDITIEKLVVPDSASTLLLLIIGCLGLLCAQYTTVNG